MSSAAPNAIACPSAHRISARAPLAGEPARISFVGPHKGRVRLAPAPLSVNGNCCRVATLCRHCARSRRSNKSTAPPNCSLARAPPNGDVSRRHICLARACGHTSRPSAGRHRTICWPSGSQIAPTFSRAHSDAKALGLCRSARRPNSIAARQRPGPFGGRARFQTTLSACWRARSLMLALPNATAAGRAEPSGQAPDSGANFAFTCLANTICAPPIRRRRPWVAPNGAAK